MASSLDLGPHFDPELLQARWILGGMNAEELVTEALTALEGGYAGNALQQHGTARPTQLR